MKINLLAASAFAAALALPLAANAQQTQAPGTRAYGQNMPSEGRLQQRWARRMRNLNLSGDQQQRIQSIIHQYSQMHPEGSARQPGANRELRRQLMGSLNGDQQNALRQQMRARRSHMGHRGQMQGGYQRQNGYPGYQQQGGYPGYQQQGGYPEYQQQGYPQGMPDQRYQQAPPDQQYQQGPPQQYQQGPPQQYDQGPPQQYDQAPPA